ncbi:doublesex- and mab-3-related transcription factor 1Y-like [Xenia sp. Carnegie-2017]|uniref:doublesex- and mab-3-related transcription factor 1Y-like n=1 Tax=Xenia sp. Carnegie-2017 TaxID=2897299 RepID=UPI001F03E868|nr:doublesex- and mab-3-related transcription factor 1Y-like [Xenia sp. Carnegie-2017]
MSNKKQRRSPQCARCRCHNVFVSVRGHKRRCQWKNCTCAKCLLVSEKRRVTAVRVAILRRERKQRILQRMAPPQEYYAGLHHPNPWGMMGRQQFSFNAPRFPVQDEMFLRHHHFYDHMYRRHYRGLYSHHHHESFPSQDSTRRVGNAGHADEVSARGISQNLRNFMNEYDSLMQKPNNNESSGNKMTSSVCNKVSLPSRDTFPDLYGSEVRNIQSQLEMSRLPLEHARFRGQRFSPNDPRGLPVIINAPHTMVNYTNPIANKCSCGKNE